MGNAVELFSRELLFLAVTAAFGSFLVRRIDPRFDRLSASLLAPALGLCIAVCVYTTLNWFFSGQQLAWTIPVLAALALLSTTPSLRRGARDRADRSRRVATRTGLLSGLQALLVVFAVTLPPSIALLGNDSVGPTTYRVYDTVGYVAESDSAQLESIHQALHSPSSTDNPVENYWTSYVQGHQQLDLAPFAGALDALVGLHSTDTQSAYMIGLLVIAALGAFAVIRLLLRRSSWFAVLGGALFAGPFFLQLFFDGSQGAIAGLAVLSPLVGVVGCTVLRPSPWSLLISSILVAGLMALYPIFVIPLGVAGLLAALLWVVRGAVRRDATLYRELPRWMFRAFVVGAFAALFDVVVARRDMAYWTSLLHGEYAGAGFPAYHLGLGVVPSWLLQTRELYTVAFGPQSAFSDVLPALLIPIVIIAVVVPQIRRRKEVWFLLLFMAIAGLLGAFEAVRNSCAYCEDRNLLPTEPALILVVTVALAGLWSSRKRYASSLSLGATALMVAFVAYSLVHAWSRFSQNSYFLTSADRSVASSRPAGDGIVQLEGFGEGANAPGEEPLSYELAFETSHGHVSIAADIDDREGLAYFGTQSLPGTWFHPNYRYVLTLLPGVTDGRQIIALSPGIALERRIKPLDVLVDTGLGLPILPAQNRSGQGTVIGPLRFLVTGEVARTVYVRFDVRPEVTPQVFSTDRDIYIHSSGGSSLICLAASGTAAYATAAVASPGLVGTVLTKVTASFTPCR